MFPLTHIAAAHAVLKRENPLTVTGSVFPDFVTYLGMGRNVGHELGNDLYYYTLAQEEAMLDFPLGVLTHGTSLPGLDTYADENYHGTERGFCFTEGEKIAAEVENICHVPPNMANWKAHNFIEIGFDIITTQKFPEIRERAEAVLLAEPSKELLAYLSGYLQVAEGQIAEMFREVPKQFCFDGNNIEEFTRKYLLSLERRHGIVGGSVKEAMTITEKAMEIVAPQYDDFMAEAIAFMTRALSNFPKVWA